jgi:hypothetical protein
MYKAEINILVNAIYEAIRTKHGEAFCPVLEDKDNDKIYDVLGMGGNGFVMRTNTPNVVLKVTADEWEIAAVLASRKNKVKGFVQTLDDVYRIGNCNVDYFIYWREEVTPLNDSDVDNEIIVNLEAINSISADLREEPMKLTATFVDLKRLCYLLLDEIVEIDSKFEVFAEMIKTNIENNVFFSDIKVNNIGKTRSSDEYVIFDSRFYDPDNAMVVMDLPYLKEEMKEHKYYDSFYKKFFKKYYDKMSEEFAEKYGKFEGGLSSLSRYFLERKIYDHHINGEKWEDD